MDLGRERFQGRLVAVDVAEFAPAPTGPTRIGARKTTSRMSVRVWETARSCKPMPASDQQAGVSNTQGYSWSMSKVMVSIPDSLLAEVDAEVKRRATSRSAFLAAAAHRELARPDSERVAAAIARSERRFASSGPFEAADLVRDDRDSRR